MFWGLTIEPGKHYSQTVDQSFHVSMAALDTREKSGMTQLLVRHEKAEFLLCTLHYGDDHPFPCLQQQLNLNLAEGSEISFYSEGKGTIHLTGYLVTDEPILASPGLLAEAEDLMLGSEEEEEEYDSEDEEEDEEDYTDSDMDSTSSQDVSWQQMIQDVDEEDDDDSEEEEWTPDAASAKKAKKNKRKSMEDSMSEEVNFSAYKKKRKAAIEAETLSKMEMAADNAANQEEDEDEDEEEDGDFNPVAALDEDDDDEDDDDFDEDDEDEEEEDEEEEEAEEEDVEDEGEGAEQKTSSQKKSSSPTKKEKKSIARSPEKTVKKEAGEAGSSESSNKKKKKKKQQKQAQENSGGGEMPLKNLKAINKENIDAQQKEKSGKEEDKNISRPVPKKIKLPSGTTIEDLKVGEGKLAKPGKKVFMYYRGVLQQNQKEFDSKLSGKPFMFSLGRGEVIKGWEEGIKGMKVGGKRRLTVPPSQGYGSQRLGPIPPNSTLVFDVELRQVR